MPSLNSYLGFTSLMTFCLGAIWSRNDLFNLLLKLTFFGFGIWGFFLMLSNSGYIVKV